MSNTPNRVVVCVLGLMAALALSAIAQQPVTVQNTVYDPCADPSKVRIQGLNSLSGSGRTVHIAADGTKRIYVCSGRIQGSDAGAFYLQFGTGTTCQTGTVAVDRHVFTANGEPPLVLSPGSSMNATFRRSAAGAELCYERVATMTVQGHIRYVQE